MSFFKETCIKRLCSTLELQIQIHDGSIGSRSATNESIDRYENIFF